MDVRKSENYEYRNFTHKREMCFFAQRGFHTFEMNTEIPRWAAYVGFFLTYVHMNTGPRPQPQAQPSLLARLTISITPHPEAVSLFEIEANLLRPPLPLENTKSDDPLREKMGKVQLVTHVLITCCRNKALRP